MTANSEINTSLLPDGRPLGSQPGGTNHGYQDLVGFVFVDFLVPNPGGKANCIHLRLNQDEHALVLIEVSLSVP